MANPDGTPIWYELLTTDAVAAQAFYAEVVGWSIAPSGMAATGDYRILTAPGGGGVGGLMTLPAGAPMKPGWLGYIGVDDVDASAAKVVELGGSLTIPPQDIPGVGRFALVADPQGLPFYVMRGDSPQDSSAFSFHAPGHCSWHELVTTDAAAAVDFYGALFGWTNPESMPMGPMGDYRFIYHRGERIGGMMNAGEGMPTRWSYYFRVPSIAAAKERATARGGTIVMGPQEVPGGDYVILGVDPQGAGFALVGAA